MFNGNFLYDFLVMFWLFLVLIAIQCCAFAFGQHTIRTVVQWQHSFRIENLLFNYCYRQNQLQSFPIHLCSLPLKILNASHNRITVLPSEVGLLSKLQLLVSRFSSSIFNLKEYTEWYVLYLHWTWCIRTMPMLCDFGVLKKLKLGTFKA